MNFLISFLIGSALIAAISFAAGQKVGHHHATKTADAEIQSARATVKKIEQSFFCAARDPIPGFPCKCWQRKGDPQ